ncbi:shikimate kinase [Clostridium sp.]|uniref:shikimate kinase n=1 Tax=Clostridium sp. TaxID=1506 RepID=UPI0039912E10
MMKKGIVLIGMPGCGKSTIGREIAKKMDFKFVDMDSFIEACSQKTIEQLFQKGEDIFRQWESKSCEVLRKLDKAVIATGGGAVKTKGNIEYFKDFTVVFINRPLELIFEDIDTEARPLLKDGKERLITLYRERIDLYKKYGQIEIINDGTIDEVVDEIIKAVDL